MNALHWGWVGVKRDGDGCYVRWPLCIQGKEGLVRGERGSESGCGCGCVDSWCCYVLKFE